MSIIPMVFTSNTHSRLVLPEIAQRRVNFYRFLFAGCNFDWMNLDASGRGMRLSLLSATQQDLDTDWKLLLLQTRPKRRQGMPNAGFDGPQGIADGFRDL
jgi:hypothetical protein